MKHCGALLAASIALLPAVAAAQDAPGAGSLAAAKAFNTFVFTDVEENTPSVRGPVAAGRDLSASGFGYNTEGMGPTGLVVGRRVVLSSGSVRGNAYYGGSQQTSSTTFTGGALSQGNGGVDFVQAEIDLGLRSLLLATLPSNGSTTVRPWAIEFVGSDLGLNVFELDAQSLGENDGLSFSVPEGSTVLVNVTGSSASLQSAGMMLGAATASRLLWNFHEASDVSLTHVGFEGTLLAPNATVTQTSGSINGQVIARALVGTNNGIYWQPFAAPLPCIAELDCADGAQCSASYSAIGPRCVADTGPEECPEPPAWAPPTAAGSLRYERWVDVTGTSIASIPVQAQPAFVEQRTTFDAPRDVRDNYGVRMRGWLRTPSAGAYQFWIAGNDNVELYLSSDHTPANKVRIAHHTSYTQYLEWNRFPSQRSAAISLQAGTWYYVEAWMKEGTGSDHLSVGWLKPGQAGNQPSELIPGQYLAPYQEVFPPPPAASAGSALFEKWLGLVGRSTSAIPVLAPSNTTEELTLLDAPRNQLNSYGARLRGWLTPPATASYIFWVAGDDNVELFLSPTPDPANKSRIAYHTDFTQYKEWAKFPTQRSLATPLERGKWYYLEALLKEEANSDHLSVAWRPATAPETQAPEIILGQYVAPYREIFPPAPSGKVGGISYDRWVDITGAQVSQIPLTLSPYYREQRTDFDAARDVREQYGARMRGWVSPPSSGQYKFWVAGNDNVALYLSPSERPDQKALIASHNSYSDYLQWFKFPSQGSAPVELEASRWYFIEALVKEGTGSDHLSVGWAQVGAPGSAPASVIARTYLAPFGCTTPNFCGDTSGPSGSFIGCGTGSLCENSADCWDDVDGNGSNDLACHDGSCSLAHCFNDTLDADETGVDCGGSCPGCAERNPCNTASDCVSGFLCLHGQCAGPTCSNGERDGSESGVDCGGNCRSCDEAASCNTAQDCSMGLDCFEGYCACVPDCSAATCSNSKSSCGTECPGVCQPKEEGCTHDVHCSLGNSCIVKASGTTQCLSTELCAYRALAPPLCGSADAPCAECPACTPQCDGRECGVDPRCGASCGTCSTGLSCSSAGSCEPPTALAQVFVPDGVGGERPVQDLPAPQTSAIGALSGDFRVTEDGAARYSIPIAVPPGRAGLEPALSIVYTGGRSSGDLGMAWKLEGLSSITRCNRSYALDGYTAPVTNTPDDRFCIDGKRLEGVGAAPYGTHGAEYRTLIDSFSKVVSSQLGTGFQTDSSVPLVSRALQGPDYFTVWTKDGRILSYGRTEDSLVVARNGVRHAWMLNRVEDRAGNSLVVTYLKEPTNVLNFATERFANTIKPLAIEYTGHGATPGNRFVYFDYEDRSDPQLNFFQGGLPLVVQKRLSRIRTVVNQVPVKNYRIAYPPTDSAELGSTVSLIGSITECSGEDDQVCKSPTRFEYAEHEGFLDRGPTLGSEISALQLDANGDGIQDAFTQTITQDGIRVSDAETAIMIVGDVATTGAALAVPGVGAAAQMLWTFGKTIYSAFAHTPHVEISHSISLSTGDRERPFTLVENVNGLPCSTGARPGFLMDYDNDGDDDFLGSCPGYRDPCSSGPTSDACEQAPEVSLTRWTFRLARSDGNGQFVYDTDLELPIIDTLGRRRVGLGAQYAGQQPLAFDVDGDGLQDLMACTDLDHLTWYRRISPTEGFASGIVIAAPNEICHDPNPTLAIFDADGDGVANLLINGGGGWVTVQYLGSPAPHLAFKTDVFPDVGHSGLGKLTALGDFNGDAFTDVWSAKTNTIWLNTGTGQFEPRLIARQVPTAGTNIPGIARTYVESEHRRTAVFDYNGDGRSDLLELWAHDSNEPFESHSNNLLQVPDSLQTALAPFLPVLYNVQNYGDLEFSAVSDVDGDGSSDLIFRPFPVVKYGTSAKTNQLKRIVDGLGNFVSIEYESGAYEAEDSCLSKQQWPEKCLPRVTGLVSRHTEGYLTSDLEVPISERRYDYRYFNAHMSLAGHGWLGFERQEVRETALSGTEVLRRTVTTNYEPVRRYTPLGRFTAATTPPYLYPLAGLVASVRVDTPVVSGPLMSGGFARRTEVRNTWMVGQSAAQRPFPWLRSRGSSTFELRDGDSSESELLAAFDELFLTDDYGNVTEHSAWRDVLVYDEPRNACESSTTRTTFANDPTTWLISNPQTITVTGFEPVASSDTQDKTQNWVLGYGTDGLLSSITRAPGTDAERVTTILRDPVFRNPVFMTSVGSGAAVFRVTGIDYDEDHVFPKTIINSMGHRTQLSFDERWGAVKNTADANFVVSQRAYDDFGRLVEIRGPDGSTIFDYAKATTQDLNTAVGAVRPRVVVTAHQQGAQGTRTGQVRQEFDNYGRLIRSLSEGLDGTNVVQEQSYDVIGRVFGVTLPHAEHSSDVPSVLYTYDALDRLTQETHSDGSAVRHEYASTVSLRDENQSWLREVGLCAVDVVRDLDQLNKENVTVLDHAGRVLRSIDGASTGSLPAPVPADSSNYKYGAFGRLVSARDILGLETRFEFDDYGRMLSVSDPDSGTTRYTYDGYDDLRTSRDPSGLLRSFQFDPLGRISSIDDAQGTTSWSYDEGINAKGRLTRTRSPGASEDANGNCQSGCISYGYEPVRSGESNRGLLQQVSYNLDGVDHTVRFTHDDLGRLKQTQYPNFSADAPVITENTYNLHGALSTVEEVGGAARRPLWQRGNTFQGHLIESETFGNGAHSNYIYDPERRFLEGITTAINGNAVQTIEYSHYLNGQVRTRLEPGIEYASYTYDSLHRLAQTEKVPLGPNPGASHFDVFQYDALGNITQNPSSAGGNASVQYRNAPGSARPGHLIRSVTTPNGANDYSHDPNGNVSQRSGPDIPGGFQTIDYTPFNLPQSITTGIDDAAQTTQFEYSAQETRTVTRSPQTTRYLIADLYQRTVAASPEDTLEERFQIYAGGRLIGEIVRANGNQQTSYFHSDHLGSIDTITNDLGEASHQRFNEFGAPQDNTDPTTRYGFTGHDQDSDLGLINMRGRIYDPLAGRFTSADPIMQAPFSTQGLNRYSYVFNDPINAVDPSGFSGLDVEFILHGVESVSGGAGTVSNAGAAASTVGTAGAVSSGAAAGVAPLIGGALSIMQTLSMAGGTPGSTTTGSGPVPTAAGATQGAAKGSSAVHQTKASVGPSMPFYGPGPDTTMLGPHPSSSATKPVVANATSGGYSISNPWWEDQIVQHPYRTWAAATAAGSLAVSLAIQGAAYAAATIARGTTETQVARVFWSGGRVAEQAAARFATATGGTTLEMTAAGLALKRANLPWSEAAPLWRAASSNFAAGAARSVDVFFGRAARADSIWATIERPLLQSSGTNIRVHLAVVP